MKTLSIKVSDSVARRLTKRATELGVPQSELVRRAIEKELSSKAQKSCGDLMDELCGFFKGPTDLSTNPKHMEGFGR